MSFTSCTFCGDTFEVGIPHSCFTNRAATWPRPTENEDQRRVVDHEENERRREAVLRFLEIQHARRTMWRKRRGWETP